METGKETYNRNVAALSEFSNKFKGLDSDSYNRGIVAELSLFS